MMKILQDELNRKNQKAAIAILIAFLITSILSALVIVYIINLMFASAQE